MKEHISEDPKLTGVLAELQKRAKQEYVHNEFYVPRVSFDIKQAIVPNPGPGRRNILELRIGTGFTFFPEDDGETLLRIERNAYRQMAAFLYDDVLKDLRGIMEVIGDGKRSDAMRLCGELYERLRP